MLRISPPPTVALASEAAAVRTRKRTQFQMRLAKPSDENNQEVADCGRSRFGRNRLSLGVFGCIEGLENKRRQGNVFCATTTSIVRDDDVADHQAPCRFAGPLSAGGRGGVRCWA